MINKDQVAGRVKEIKGSVEQNVGKVVGNDKLRAQGTVDKISGKVQSKVGDVRADVEKRLKD